jgi:hypothetical protein
MKKEWKPQCSRCGKIIPVGLELTSICVECLIKRTKK